MTDAQRARLATLKERVSRLHAAKTEALSLVERWRARAEMMSWAEYDSGHSFAVGDRVRYLLSVRVCKKAHTKALLRSPSNAEYWEDVPEDE